jgi:hypothetical protein
MMTLIRDKLLQFYQLFLIKGDGGCLDHQQTSSIMVHRQHGRPRWASLEQRENICS